MIEYICEHNNYVKTQKRLKGTPILIKQYNEMQAPFSSDKLFLEIFIYYIKKKNIKNPIVGLITKRL